MVYLATLQWLTSPRRAKQMINFRYIIWHTLHRKWNIKPQGQKIQAYVAYVVYVAYVTYLCAYVLKAST